MKKWGRWAAHQAPLRQTLAGQHPLCPQVPHSRKGDKAYTDVSGRPETPRSDKHQGNLGGQGRDWGLQRGERSQHEPEV